MVPITFSIQTNKEKGNGFLLVASDKTDALRFLQTFKRDDYERRQKTKRKLLSEFLIDFLSYAEGSFSKETVEIYKASLKNFVSIVGDLPLVSYTPQHFDIHKTERQKPVKVVTIKDGHVSEKLKTVSPVTVNIELRTLRAFFRYSRPVEAS